VVGTKRVVGEMKEGENNVYTMDTIENKCSICKGRPTRAHRKIWDGKDFIEMGEPYLATFELYELQCMAFSVEMKDHWSDSDFKGMDLIRRIIQEKKDGNENEQRSRKYTEIP
jgi:hypothetical protein